VNEISDVDVTSLDNDQVDKLSIAFND